MIVFYLLYFLLFIGKILILKKEKKTKERKLWPIYFASLVTEVLSVIGIIIYFSSILEFTFNTLFILGFLLLIVFLESFILMIIGIALYIKQKKDLLNNGVNIEKDCLFIQKIIGTIICIVGVVFVGFATLRLLTINIEFKAKNIAINYMNKKYGDGDFKVIKVIKNYDYESFSSESFSGFTFYLKSSYVPKPIYVSVKGTEVDKLYVATDSLVTNYYSYDYISKLYKDLEAKKKVIVNNDFKEQFNIILDLDFESFNVPDDFGHIPTIEELVDLTEVNTGRIKANINDRIDESDKLDYYKKLAQFSIKYFDTDDIFIYCTWNGKFYWNSDSDFIEVKNGLVTIKINGEEKVFKKQDIVNMNFE